MARSPEDPTVIAYRYGLVPLAVWTAVISALAALEIYHLHHDILPTMAGYGGTWLVVACGIVLSSMRRYTHEQKLKESEWRLRTLSESSTDWEYWIKEDGEIAYMSPSSLEITGYAPDEFIMDNGLRLKLIHPDDMEMYLTHQNSFESQQHGEMRIRIIKKDGSTRWVSHICAPLYMDGVFRGRRINNRDITRLVDIENQKEDLRAMLRHDIKNPLTVIQGNIEMVMERCGKTLDEESLQMLKSADGSVNVVKRMLDDMSIISRIESSVPDLEKNPEDLGDLLLEVCYSARSQAAMAGLKFDSDIAAGLPSISINRGYVVRCILNLVNNAVKFTPPGGSVRLSAGVADDGPGRRVFIKVSDTGIGIPAEELQKIFEKHYRSRSSRHIQGSGLGLALVKLVMDSHGGNVGVESEEGRGSSFTLYFPAGGNGTKAGLRPVG